MRQAIGEGMTNLEKPRRRVVQALYWIENHGADLDGYVARYGSANDPDRYGDGGEAIYAADLGAYREALDDYWTAIRKYGVERLHRETDDSLAAHDEAFHDMLQYEATCPWCGVNHPSVMG